MASMVLDVDEVLYSLSWIIFGSNKTETASGTCNVCQCDREACDADEAYIMVGRKYSKCIDSMLGNDADVT